jgi:hypothetical protein
VAGSPTETANPSRPYEFEVERLEGGMKGHGSFQRCVVCGFGRIGVRVTS